ncbi:hypothetical protein T439DRAFT_32941 [Meredithblackwellia eburnea MCA 4105]
MMAQMFKPLALDPHERKWGGLKEELREKVDTLWKQAVTDGTDESLHHSTTITDLDNHGVPCDQLGFSFVHKSLSQYLQFPSKEGKAKQEFVTWASREPRHYRLHPFFQQPYINWAKWLPSEPRGQDGKLLSPKQVLVNEVTYYFGVNDEIVDWWCEVNELRHRVWTLSSDNKNEHATSPIDTNQELIERIGDMYSLPHRSFKIKARAQHSRMFA